MLLLLGAAVASLLAMPMPFGLCRALSMPFRAQTPRRAALTRHRQRRRASLKEHAWEDNVLRNLTVAYDGVRGVPS